MRAHAVHLSDPIGTVDPRCDTCRDMMRAAQWPVIAYDDIRPGDTVERVFVYDGVTDVRRFTVESRNPARSTTRRMTTNLKPVGAVKRVVWDRPGCVWHLLERP